MIDVVKFHHYDEEKKEYIFEMDGGNTIQTRVNTIVFIDEYGTVYERNLIYYGNPSTVGELRLCMIPYLNKQCDLNIYVNDNVIDDDEYQINSQQAILMHFKEEKFILKPISMFDQIFYLPLRMFQYHEVIKEWHWIIIMSLTISLLAIFTGILVFLPILERNQASYIRILIEISEAILFTLITIVGFTLFLICISPRFKAQTFLGTNMLYFLIRCGVVSYRYDVDEYYAVICTVILLFFTFWFVELLKSYTIVFAIQNCYKRYYLDDIWAQIEADVNHGGKSWIDNMTQHYQLEDWSSALPNNFKLGPTLMACMFSKHFEKANEKLMKLINEHEFSMEYLAIFQLIPLKLWRNHKNRWILFDWIIGLVGAILRIVYQSTSYSNEMYSLGAVCTSISICRLIYHYISIVVEILYMHHRDVKPQAQLWPSTFNKYGISIITRSMSTYLCAIVLMSYGVRLIVSDVNSNRLIGMLMYIISIVLFWPHLFYEFSMRKLLVSYFCCCTRCCFQPPELNENNEEEMQDIIQRIHRDHDSKFWIFELPYSSFGLCHAILRHAETNLMSFQIAFQIVPAVIMNLVCIIVLLVRLSRNDWHFSISMIILIIVGSHMLLIFWMHHYMFRLCDTVQKDEFKESFQKSVKYLTKAFVDEDENDLDVHLDLDDII